VDKRLPLWCERVDSFYFLVDKSIDNFFISPCTALLSKCFFLPFHDDRFTVCTPIDNEILRYCSSLSIYVISSYLRNMYMTPTNNRNASQSIVRTSNSSSQHPQIFQQQHSTQQQHSVIRQPSSQVTNLFGPVRSSPTRCEYIVCLRFELKSI
ncbi:unnamed protein product, partial [Rotaria magnacalcarata]